MKHGVEIIECLDKKDPGSEGRCLKHIFNLMDIESRYTHVNSIDSLLESIAKSKYKYIHISAHSYTGNQDKFKGWWTPNGIGTKSIFEQNSFKSSTTAIVSTACKSGTSGFGRFITNELGCKYFIGPTGSPRFYNAILFAHVFYHKLFKTKRSVKKAFESYDEAYKNPHGFKLYQKGKP